MKMLSIGTSHCCVQSAHQVPVRLLLNAYKILFKILAVIINDILKMSALEIIEPQ